MFGMNRNSNTRIIVYILGMYMLFGYAVWCSAGNNELFHDFMNDCQTCHKGNSESGELHIGTETFNDIETLCIRCHNFDRETSHPTGVVVRSPGYFEEYLSSGGRITCVTCHEVHKDGRTSQDYLLREEISGIEFCAECHNEDISGVAEWSHGLSIDFAHSPRDANGNSHELSLDMYTVMCLSCHDDNVSPKGAVMIESTECGTGIGNYHPVGRNYPVQIHRGDFISRELLDNRIKLYNNQIGCLSCHNLYSENKSLLVMSNRRSALCLSCHNK